MSAYHSLLEEGLNSTVKLSKLSADLIPKPKQVWISQSKPGVEVVEQREKDLISLFTPQCASFPDQLSGLYTFKLISDLASQKTLQLLIPETIIYGYGFESPTFLFTDHKGTLQVISGLGSGSFPILSDIFSAHRTINKSLVAPLALVKSPNSLYNKVLMRENELKADWRNLLKSDEVCQRYVLSKGNKSSKLRVVYKKNEISVFKITNKANFDRSAYEASHSFVRSAMESPTKPPEADMGKNPDLLREQSSSPIKEIKYESLSQFMNSINELASAKELSELFSQLGKHYFKHIDEPETIVEDIINNKIFTKLRSMFCTESGNIKASTIIELKSEKRISAVCKIFNLLKNHTNSSILQPQNLKISEFTCDFVENTDKVLFFLKVKHLKAVSSIHVPLKSLQKNRTSNYFKCPGEYCYASSQNNTELFGQSILFPCKKVFPKECKVLRGTIMEDKVNLLNTSDLLKLRLFERVKVCQNCFLVYNEKVNKKINHKVLKTSEQVDLKDDFMPFTESRNKLKVKRDPSYMGKLGVKLHNFNKKMLTRTFTGALPRPSPSKSHSIFSASKKIISESIHFEAF